MYNRKKIIGVTGRTCSGKSTLLDLLKAKTKCLCIKLDELDTGISKKERMWIIEKFGIEALEHKVIKTIRSKALRMIGETSAKTVVIEGIKLKKYFDDLVDAYIEFNVPYEERVQNSQSKGWSEEKFKFIDGLYNSGG